jgi:hypothetical protein
MFSTRGILAEGPNALEPSANITECDQPDFSNTSANWHTRHHHQKHSSCEATKPAIQTTIRHLADHQNLFRGQSHLQTPKHTLESTTCPATNLLAANQLWLLCQQWLLRVL